MAQKVKFTKDFDHRANARVEIAYKRGQEVLIPEAHYEAAKAAGAVEAPAETKAEEPKAEAKRK
jgi:hypothetical protein